MGRMGSSILSSYLVIRLASWSVSALNSMLQILLTARIGEFFLKTLFELQQHLAAHAHRDTAPFSHPYMYIPISFAS
jgi:hypothetical protein